MLTKNEIARRIEDGTGIKPALSKRVMDELAVIAEEEVGSGEDFTIPGIVRITWRFSPKRTKGEMYRKGDTVTGPQGERVADADSAARPAKIALKAMPTGAVGRVRPKRDEMANFVKGKVGKAIAKRKAR